MNHLLCVFAASLAILVVAACSESSSPTAPTPAAPRAPTPTPTPTPTPVSTSSFLGNIMDVDTHRKCIENASAEMITGPFAGTTYPQNLEDCDDPGAGIIINGLPVDSVIRLRASAPGYTSVERDFVIQQSGGSIDINLKRAE